MREQIGVFKTNYNQEIVIFTIAIEGFLSLLTKYYIFSSKHV